MTADTDALREKLAETLHYGQGLDDWGAANDDERGEALALADEVLPLVAAEVRKAKAEAWDEGYLDRSPYGGRAQSRADNPYRETGDSDEHR